MRKYLTIFSYADATEPLMVPNSAPRLFARPKME